MQTIVVFLECTRRDHLGCYGYGRDTTPFLDSVAREGVRWAAFEAAGSRTNETFPRIAPPFRAMFEAGVHTAFYSSNAFPAGREIQNGAAAFKRFLPSETRRDRGPDAPLVSAEIIEDFSRGYHDREDFVAFFHFRESHTPYEPGKHLKRFLKDRHYRAHLRKWGPFSKANIRALDRHRILIEHNGPEAILYPGTKPRVKGKRVGWSVAFYIAAYDGAIRTLDGELHNLFEAFPDAAIFVTADHGEALGEHGQWFSHVHGRFPELLRVPLIARIPGAKPAVIEAPCTHMNLMRTIARRHGIKAKKCGVVLPMED